MVLTKHLDSGSDCDSPRLARHLDPRLYTPLGPVMGKVGARQYFTLIDIERGDIAGLRSDLMRPQACVLHYALFLFPSRSAPGPALTDAFLLSNTLSRKREVLAPVCCLTSVYSRGTVLLTQLSTSWCSTNSTTAKARLSSLGDRSGTTEVNHLYQCCTASAAPSVASICGLVQPCKVNRSACARSVSPHT